MYKVETDSSISSEEETSVKRKAAKKKTNLKTTATTATPYGRRRTCWKRNPSEAEKLSKSVPEAGIITCAICGVRRYYKFVKQCRKFGLHSCEPCRKFISTMIADVRNGSQYSFTCVKKGPTNCLTTESLQGENTVKTKKDCLSNVRCRACWLALCLEKYEMPSALKYSLAQFIAEDVRPSFSTNETENDSGFRNLTKQRSQRNHSVKSCIKALTSNYIRQNNMFSVSDGSLHKVVIFRIKDVW